MADTQQAPVDSPNSLLARSLAPKLLWVIPLVLAVALPGLMREVVDLDRVSMAESPPG